MMRPTSKIVTGTVVFLLIAACAGTIYFWKRPLEVYAWYGRRALTRAGLEKLSADTPFGRQVAWQGGAGPTMVLLHDAGDQAGIWSAVVPALASRYRLLIPDLPGHGDSAPEAGPLSIGTVWRGVEALMGKAAPDQPAIVVGNSLGAWIGMLLALDKPGRIARLVLVDGAGSTGDRTDLSIMPANRDEARKLIDAIRDPASPYIRDFVLDDLIRQANSGPISRLAAAARDMQPYLFDKRLGELRVPVDLLWGESDRLLSVDYAKGILKQLPAARFTLIPRCGHVPQQECPDKFIESLLKVLDQAPPGVSR